MITSDYSVSVAFLRSIYPSGPWMLTAISVDKKAIEARTFLPDQEEDVLAWLYLHKNRNLYYSVNEPIQDAYEKKKLSKSDVLRVHFLHVDVDPRTGEDVEAEQVRILKQIESYKIPPTHVVFSGGGYNALWRLDSPVSIAHESPSVEETLRRAIDVERRNWQFELDFETPDHCRDVSRILRLPGTINRPNEEKIKKGRVPSLARIVRSESTSYPLSAFLATPHVSDNSGSGRDRRISSDVKRIETLDSLPRSLPDRVKVIIAQGFDPEDKSWNGDRSEVLFFVCCELVRSEVDDATILGIITDSRFGISASVLDKGNQQMRYAMRQVGRARDKAFHPKLSEFNENYAVVANMGGRCMIMIEDDGRDVEFMKPSEFFKARDHEKIEYIGSNGKPKQKGVASWWFDQRRRRQYEHVVFEPGTDSPGDFNLWRGFAVDPVPGDRHLRYLEHVYTNICRGKQEVFDYLVNWMARVVQQPRTQSMTAIVLLGSRGTGKSVFVDFFRMIFGKRHSYVASDVQEITGRFNSHLAHSVLVVAEEAFDLRDRRHESVLKQRITGTTIGVEYKGADIIQRSNYIHMMMTSNNEKVVPAGDKERRFLVIRVGEGRIQDAEYFKQIILEDVAAGGVSHLLHHLLSVDLSGFDVTKVPYTSELRKQQEHSLTTENDWLLEKLEHGQWLPEGRTRWEGPLQKPILYGSYLNYCSALNIARPMSLRKFGIWLRNELGENLVGDKQLSPQPDHSRPWAFVFGSLEACRAKYLENRGWKEHDWPQPLQIVEGPSGEEIPVKGEIFG